MKERAKWAAPLAAIASAFAALACCLPFGFLAALGAAGAGLFFARYRIWFIGLAPLFLAFGFWQYYRAPRCSVRTRRLNGVLLGIATLVVLAILLFPQWIASLLAGAPK